jgi:rubrerythrin
MKILRLKMVKKSKKQLMVYYMPFVAFLFIEWNLEVEHINILKLYCFYTKTQFPKISNNLIKKGRVLNYKKIDEFFASLPSQSDISFPPIKVEKENLDYANLLLNPLASSADSELQAITQYIYHSKTISNDIISKALMSIALVEMGHLDSLSELISLLGGKPFYQNSNNNFWMTGNIAYVDKNNIYDKHSDNSKNDKSSVRQKLENNINGEENAINGYTVLLM